jgi:hypothetical protein
MHGCTSRSKAEPDPLILQQLNLAIAPAYCWNLGLSRFVAVRRPLSRPIGGIWLRWEFVGGIQRVRSPIQVLQMRSHRNFRSCHLGAVTALQVQRLVIQIESLKISEITGGQRHRSWFQLAVRFRSDLNEPDGSRFMPSVIPIFVARTTAFSITLWVDVVSCITARFAHRTRKVIAKRQKVIGL